MLGELADGGGFARAVHAHHHQHGGVLATDVERLLQGTEQIGQRVGEQAANLGGRFGAGRFHAPTQISQQRGGGGHAGVGHDEGRFEFFVQRFVDLAAAEQAADARAGFAQAGAQAAEPAGSRLLFGDEHDSLRCLGLRPRRSGGLHGRCGFSGRI